MEVESVDRRSVGQRAVTNVTLDVKNRMMRDLLTAYRYNNTLVYVCTYVCENISSHHLQALYRKRFVTPTKPWTWSHSPCRPSQEQSSNCAEQTGFDLSWPCSLDCEESKDAEQIFVHAFLSNLFEPTFHRKQDLGNNKIQLTFV